jgi:hypothetical protein
MIFLARTRGGLEDALRAAAPIGAAVWCSSDALPDPEYHRRALPRLTRFDHGIATPEELEDALATIVEHHPGESVWVEALTR